MTLDAPLRTCGECLGPSRVSVQPGDSGPGQQPLCASGGVPPSLLWVRTQRPLCPLPGRQATR